MGRLLIDNDPCNSSVKSLCSSSMLQNWVTCHSAVAAKHWNPRQRRKKEKAIRIFGDFLYCALCTTSLWTEMKNQRWKLFGIEILLQNIILAHHLASFWILRIFQIYIIKAGICLSVCQHLSVLQRLIILQFWSYWIVKTMAFLWPSGGNKANWRNIWAKIFFFKKMIYVIPSALLSFLR